MKPTAVLFACGLALAAYTLNASSNAGLPDGWSVGGEAPKLYHADVDAADSPSGKGAMVLMRTDTSHPYGSAWLAQRIPADAYAGKRVRVSMRVRFQDIEPMEGKIYIGLDGGASLQGMRFSQDWTVYESTLSLPAGVKQLDVGVGLKGPGSARVDGIALQVLGDAPAGLPGLNIERSDLRPAVPGEEFK
ncbi:hypothetical protein [Massilia sp. ZL223]|uniref:hypothetical protein n=1 Tax=Massilia sp. ZL223 TaxID=2824904 RepID=UPI001B80EC37|nr:hypothetical protein [Massilia sp. ZL223]MBQ5964304.1 hypothetical protein [Massilia sp. ZL223]